MKNFLNKKKFFISLIILISLFLLYSFLNTKPSIVSVYPAPNSEQVDTSVTPSVIFSKPLAKAQQDKILIKTSPSANFSKYWSGDGRILYLSPSYSLAQNTNYQITLSNPAYSWFFKTAGVSRTSDQGFRDYKSNKGLQDFYTSHPWYDKLPPRNDNFFIGYDFSKDEFFADLYPKTTSQTPINEQTNQLKKDVLESLRSIGIDTTNLKVVWIISPR